MAFESGMNLKMKAELRKALFAEATRQGISPPKLITKLLEAELLNPTLNGELNESKDNGSAAR
ncbi:MULTISPECIES: hypothetical protein [Enterobacterales]|uniref:hypothetical protein n=1 Tax=Enterobacterales TaxID=91347 RepID=UPI001CC8FE38|nr:MULTISPECIES: hypothetical protein [Enterobacterales]MBZ7458986.1 hypothetical protein [Klebsiella michiganensis]MDU4127984.1 hypothetical protein [Pantoea sp.]